MRVKTTPIAAALLLLAAVNVQAQASLDTAKQLYATAEYESALAMLDGLRAGERPREEQQTIELYRVLCLVATGKESDAKGVMEGLVTRDPMYRPSNDLPPRVRSTYSETRKRMLPAAVQSAYLEAKAAFDFKDYVGAQRGFALVLEVLADPDMQMQASKSPLSDIRTLATGFHELSAKATTPPEPAARALPQAPVVPDLPAPQPARAVLPPARTVAKVYSASDTNVVPPIALRQQIPAYPGQIRIPQTGVIEVVIDILGGVESASMAASVNPQYDRLALTAARLWQYQPARVDGVPVKFLKRIQVNLVPTTN
jgi:TonB family protein